MARDITHHRLQQERIARLSRIHAVLSGINSAILRIRGREELYREACRIAVEDGGFLTAWIGTVSGEARVEPVAWAGRSAAYMEKVHSMLSARGVVRFGLMRLVDEVLCPDRRRATTTMPRRPPKRRKTKRAA